jgi:cytoskeletal protein CcmA (bactofilin family)
MLQSFALLPRQRRRGSAYLVVLGVTLIVSAIAYSGILMVRARARMVSETSDAAEARQIARDAIEIGKQWIHSDANWRTTRTSGVWATNVPLSGGSFSLSGTDPADGDFKNFPHDLVLLKATAIKGSARHVLEVNVVAKPDPLPALRYAVHAGGEVHVTGGKSVSVGSGTVSTNGSLRNDGTINGNIDVLLVSNPGTVSGTRTIGSLAKDLPSTTIVDNYIALGTLIVTSNIDKRAIGPGVNPFGALDANGIYVVRPGADLVIKNSHICGTLVVDNAGKKVTLDNNVLLHPHRADCPALIVRGDAEIIFDGGDGLLDEKNLGVNLNPPGVPYNGITDTKDNDKFPSEIQGLIHVTGKLTMKQTARVRGAILVNSTAGSDAAKFEGTSQIIHTPTLLTSAPCWYTLSVPMVVSPGSWRQLAQ